MTPRSLSFKGCKTRREAAERFRGFLEQIAIESALTFPDADWRDEMLLKNYEAIEAQAVKFRLFLDAENIGPQE